MKRHIFTLLTMALVFQITFATNVEHESNYRFTADNLTTDLNKEENTELTSFEGVHNMETDFFVNDLIVGEIVINEILPNGTVELKNIGDEAVDISVYWLCNFPFYSQISNLNFLCGTANVGAGEIVAIDGFDNLQSADGELGLYLDNSFGSSASIIDYVQWGSAGHQRETVAVMAGIWTADDFFQAFGAGESLNYDGEGNTSGDWSSAACTSICSENILDPVDGGTISTSDPTTTCAGDGVGDPINVALENNSGTNSAWVITDTLGNILGLPPGSPFDLEGAGEGVCLIWHLSFEDGLTGAEVGMNASDLSGCFDLSNPIAVTRNGVNGGELMTVDSLTETIICAGDGVSDEFDIILDGDEGTNSAWVITDTLGNILGLPPGPPFDLEGAGEGVCLIWHLSYEDGLTGAEVGMNAGDLSGCFDLSNPITVTRNGVNGGDLIMSNGFTNYTICAGDGMDDPINVNLNNVEGANSAWVITDQMGNILGLPAGPPFNLEGAGEGVCLIWHLSYEDGLTGAEVGLNASDLSGCFDLSNPITITRLVNEACEDICNSEAGEISTDDPATICAGDGMSDPIDVMVTGNAGSNFAWVITDTLGNILGLPAGPPFDLDGAGTGVCLIWHLSFENGLTGAEVGMNAADLEGCFDLSNPITVIRNGVNGGDLETVDGQTELTICAGDGGSDAFDVTLTNTEGTNSAWVITDTLGNILGLPASPPFDLEGAGTGVCLIWHLSFEDGLTGAEVGMNAVGLSGCFDLSNPIMVTRNGINGGDLITTDSLTELTICAGDGVADAFDVALTNTEGTNSAWVITDTLGNILGLPAAPPFDLEGAGEGVCLVWNLSFEDGLMGAEVGMNAGDLSGCFSLSNPIKVNRIGVDGGSVTTVDGETTVNICIGDGVADSLFFANTSTAGNYQYVVTDENNVILGLPDANIQDFEGAGFGICRVWGLSYTGNLLAQPGDDAAAVDLSDECFVLSADFVTVVRDTTGEDCFTPTFEINPADIQMVTKPNPVQNTLLVEMNFQTIQGRELEVEIYNAMGRLVGTRKYQASSQVNFSVEVQNFPAGMYLIKAMNGNRIVTRRFVKQ